jgi:hypothetical protein
LIETLFPLRRSWLYEPAWGAVGLLVLQGPAASAREAALEEMPEAVEAIAGELTVPIGKRTITRISSYRDMG